MKLNLIDILNNLGLNQTEQNGIFYKKATTNFGDILGLFLAQFFANVKTENFESICFPQTEESLEQFYSKPIPELKGYQSVDEKETSELQALILFKLNPNPQIAEQLNAFTLNQESREVKASPNSALEQFFLAKEGEVLKSLQSLNLKDKINPKREIHKFIVKGESEGVDLSEAIREFVVANRVKYGDVKDGKVEISVPENLQNEINLKSKLASRKSENVTNLKFEPYLRELALENDVKIYKAGVGEILKENNKVNVEEPIFSSKKSQSQFKNQEHNTDVKTVREDVALASFEHNQTRNEFDLQHEFKRFELSSVKFEKVYEKVGNWSLSFIDTMDVGDKVNVRDFTISVKAQEIPDVVKALVSKNGDLAHGEVVLRVEPEEIGKVVVKISQGENGVKILFEVKNLEAKQLIESGFNNLRSALESSNVNPEKLGVLLVSENLNNNYFDSSNSDRGQFLKKASKRKIFDSFDAVKFYGGSLIEAII